MAAVMFAGPEDIPFLPVAGELYWVRTVILWSGDNKPTRPVVVIVLRVRGPLR